MAFIRRHVLLNARYSQDAKEGVILFELVVGCVLLFVSFAQVIRVYMMVIKMQKYMMD